MLTCQSVTCECTRVWAHDAPGQPCCDGTMATTVLFLFADLGFSCRLAIVDVTGQSIHKQFKICLACGVLRLTKVCQRFIQPNPDKDRFIICLANLKIIHGFLITTIRNLWTEFQIWTEQNWNKIVFPIVGNCVLPVAASQNVSSMFLLRWWP